MPSETSPAGRTRMRSLAKRAVLALGALGLVAALQIWPMRYACGPLDLEPASPALGADGSATIAQCLLLPHEGWAVLRDRLLGGGERAPVPQYGDFVRYRPAADSRAVPHRAIAQHPFMASGGNSMHNDSYTSDVYAARGPRGLDTKVHSRTQGFGGYGTLAFDRAGRIVAVQSNGRGFQIELMDPDTLEELASYDLPGRPWHFPLQGVVPWKYIGAGMYFYLDHLDRAVVPTTGNEIVVVQTPAPGSTEGFELVRSYDLGSHVVELPWPREDSVAWVLPSWNGEHYWFASLEGMVGTVEVQSGRVTTLRLPEQLIENSFAVGEEGVFFVTDRALLRMHLDSAPDAGITSDWRVPYDRGPGVKPGHITRGSGSSVTLVGDPETGFVIITDNAEPRIHLKVHRRSDGLEVCEVPLFPEGRSGTDLSVNAFEHADGEGAPTGRFSVLIENNWGHHRFPRPKPVPGLTRVDVVALEDGEERCTTPWESGEKSIGVAKLSLGSGLAYMYGPDDNATATGWYLTAIDFATGETVYRKAAGVGHGYNNWQGALFLHPESGALYTTTIFGLLMMQD